MKKTIAFNALLCAFIISIFSSCSIQKRRYSGGFHVEWHGDKNHQKDKPVEQNWREDQVSIEEEKNRELQFIDNEIDVLQEAKPQSEKSVILEKKNFKKLKYAESINQPMNIQPEKFIAAADSLGKVQPPAEQHQRAKSSIRLMLTAYGLIVFAIIALFAFVALAFSGFVTISAILFTLFLYTVIFLSIILAIVASVKAMFSLWEMNRTPIRYTNRWHAILAIVLGVIYLWLLFLLPLIIFFIKVQVTKNREKTMPGPAQPSFDSHE